MAKLYDNRFEKQKSGLLTETLLQYGKEDPAAVWRFRSSRASGRDVELNRDGDYPGGESEVQRAAL